MITRYTWAMTM